MRLKIFLLFLSLAITVSYFFRQLPHHKKRMCKKCSAAHPSSTTHWRPKPILSYYVLKPGDNLVSVLKKMAIRGDKISQVLKLITKESPNAFIPLKRMAAGDTFFFEEENNSLRKITYKKNFLNTYYILFQNNGCVNLAMPCYQLKKATIQVKGAILSSLYESMLRYGENPKLVINFAEILEWDIDFYTETQPGDSFFCLVEKKFIELNDSNSVFYDYGRLLAVRYKGKAGDYYGIYYEDPKGNKGYYDLKGQSLKKAFLKSPLRYSYISSHFSKARVHPILKIVRPHRGIDYAAPIGTPVSALGEGYISFIGYKGGYGKLIEITHPNGYKTRYGHLSRYAKNMRRGKRVQQGEIIGYVGMTGLATGPHLHFEVLKDGRWINPIKLPVVRKEPVKQEYLSDFYAYRESILSAINEKR